MATWMIEGRWSGPTYPIGDYTELQHREYTTNHDFAMQVRELGVITFGDQTTLTLTVTPRSQHDGKRLPELDGYPVLIRDCVRMKVNTVDKLLAKKRKP